MKVVVLFSGGKDSLASLIWAIEESGFEKKDIVSVFCDTGWEHELTYQYITQITSQLGIQLIILKNKKYDGFVFLAKKKKRFPSIMARFCTEELKIKPTIDYILDECNENILLIQGIRKEESKSRSLMKDHDNYFRYYFEPYGFNKKGEKKQFNYRKKDVIKWCEKYSADVFRPCFDLKGDEVIQKIIDYKLKPNPLYYQGSKRVGCYPCIACRQSDIRAMILYHPKYIKRIDSAEKFVGKTFFSPNYIPIRFMSQIDEKTGKPIPTCEDVIKYVKNKNINNDLFENENSSCMSFYGICE